MAHDHQHHHSIQNIKWAFFLNLGFTIIEIIGGIYVNSVSIVSDAIHDLGDSLSLGSAWYLEIQSKKKATQKFSYGYSRLSLLSALINSLVLILGGVYVLYQAIMRIIHPEPSDAQGMFFLALLGILVNGLAAYRVNHGSSLNERVITWHFIEDILGWVAVLIVSIALYFTDNMYLDPILSIIITLYVSYGVFRRLYDTLYIFLQGTPKEIDINKVKKEILSIPHVQSIHHIHIWSMEGEQNIFSCHVKLKGIDSLNQIIFVKSEIKEKLHEFPIHHTTIETELEDEPCSMINQEH